MKQYNAYLFDWDGTLTETLEVWLYVMRTVFEQYGFHYPDDVVVNSIGRTVPHALEHGIKSDQLDEFMLAVKTLSAQELPKAELYEGAVDVLERLKNEGSKLALISSNWRSNLDQLLQQHSLEQTFDLIISGEDVAKHKPDPEGILRALDKLHVPKENAVMLGDSPFDLEAATNAGIDSILFYPPGHQLFYKLSDLKSHEPVRIIDGWNKLLLPETAD